MGKIFNQPSVDYRTSNASSGLSVHSARIATDEEIKNKTYTIITTFSICIMLTCLTVTVIVQKCTNYNWAITCNLLKNVLQDVYFGMNSDYDNQFFS
jgi:hypothetical protein